MFRNLWCKHVYGYVTSKNNVSQLRSVHMIAKTNINLVQLKRQIARLLNLFIFGSVFSACAFMFIY